MSAASPDLRSKLSRAKGLGAAHHGVGHWWVQRVTAVALVPLTFWFISSLIAMVIATENGAAAQWFTSPCNAVLLCLMLVAMFWHAKLGFQVVVEDYIKCPVAKYGLLLANNFIAFAFAAISILAVLKLHFAISL